MLYVEDAFVAAVKRCEDVGCKYRILCYRSNLQCTNRNTISQLTLSNSMGRTVIFSTNLSRPCPTSEPTATVALSRIGCDGRFASWHAVARPGARNLFSTGSAPQTGRKVQRRRRMGRGGNGASSRRKCWLESCRSWAWTSSTFRLEGIGPHKISPWARTTRFSSSPFEQRIQNAEQIV